MLEQEALDLQRGLFLIRYQSADNKARPPKIVISIDQESHGDVELIVPPGVTHTILQAPGACLVARALKDCRLWTAIELSETDASGSVSVELTELSNDPIGNESTPEGIETAIDLSNLRIR